MYLTQGTICALERTIGISLGEVAEMGLDEELAYVEQKTGQPVHFPRGRRVCTMDEINKKITKLKSRKR